MLALRAHRHRRRGARRSPAPSVAPTWRCRWSGWTSWSRTPAATAPESAHRTPATVRPPERVAQFLGGPHPVRIVAPPAEKSWDLSIVVPGGGHERSGRDGSAVPADISDDTAPKRPPSIWPHVENRILEQIQQHRSTIVFANSRRLAERLTAHLNELHAEQLGRASTRTSRRRHR